MNGSNQSPLVQAVILAGMLMVGVIVVWAVVVMSASLQAGFTNSAVVPLLVGIVVGAILVLGSAWFIRHIRRSRRGPDA